MLLDRSMYRVLLQKTKTPMYTIHLQHVHNSNIFHKILGNKLAYQLLHKTKYQIIYADIFLIAKLLKSS